ncbi:MAG: phytanoyl-CoA dioxygenase family protein [Rhodobacteraceae bacterium]|nr:phytanoyl-CoA dioxygenase family protein [Paracoccaceae bacterium]
MTAAPCASITNEDRNVYARDGVVCVRGVFNAGECADMLAMFDEELAVRPDSHGRTRLVPQGYARYVMTPRIPALVGALVGATAVGFFYNQMFEKTAHNAKRTSWHHDAAGWPMTGEHIVGCWIALTPVTPGNGLECIGGSHKFPQLYWGETANGRALAPPSDRPRCPDFELRRDDPTVRFLGWTMTPGDALFIHPRTLHFSCGNRSGERRVALATWWHGDDLAWDPRPECEPYPPGIDPINVVPGAHPEGASIPILWRAAGA